MDENLIIGSPVASQCHTGNKEIISDVGGGRTYVTTVKRPNPPGPSEKNMYGNCSNFNVPHRQVLLTS